MNLHRLQGAISEIKTEIEHTIRTATYKGREYANGLAAKQALIRSQNLILKVHEVVKLGLLDEISGHTTGFTIHPPLGQRSPEKRLLGLLKAKQQDVVVVFDDVTSNGTRIKEGPLAGTYDELGKDKSERSIVIGVRSQLSSIDKNFDTLMERAFAETLNLRLRMPNLVMGDVYLLPVIEYDDNLMKSNRIGWKNRNVAIEKFITTFLAITDRSVQQDDPEIYKYERVALVLVDFRVTPPHIFLSTDELIRGQFLRDDFPLAYEALTPQNFTHDITSMYFQRHPLP